MSHESIQGMQPRKEVPSDEADVFRRFIKERGMTPKQVDMALSMYYEQGSAGGEVMDAEVYELAKMFQDADERGVPLNVFGDVLRTGPEREKKDSRTEMLGSFLDFAKKSGLSAQQFEDAMSIFLNGESSEEASPDEAVYSLAKMFSDFERDKGMTVDMPGKALIELRRREAALGRFISYVDGLPIGESDKQVLKGVLDAGKSGSIVFRYLKPAKVGLPPVGFEIGGDFFCASEA